MTIIQKVNPEFWKSANEKVTRQGNATPVIILTKTDMCENAGDYVKKIEDSVSNANVHAVFAINNIGIDGLSQYLKPGKTIALLGSSGVGKSTLVNVLAGETVMDTESVREKDSKGRHTTTYRQMFVLDSGVTIIDTPGMREFGMTEVEEGLRETFSDNVDLSSRCKFRNCSHESEPGCEVKAAIRSGILSEERLELYKRLRKEGKK